MVKTEGGPGKTTLSPQPPSKILVTKLSLSQMMPSQVQWLGVGGSQPSYSQEAVGAAGSPAQEAHL